MCPKVSSHLALLEEPEQEAQVQQLEQEPVRKPQALARVQLRQEPVQEPVLLQRALEVQEPERAQTSTRVSSLLEIAPAPQVSDFPRAPLERVRLLESQALPSRPVPDWQAAPPVVNRTQPGENQGP
jgi:hypothetical protein